MFRLRLMWWLLWRFEFFDWEWNNWSTFSLDCVALFITSRVRNMKKMIHSFWSSFQENVIIVPEWWVVASENTSAFQQKALGFHFYIFIEKYCKQRMVAKNNLKTVYDSKKQFETKFLPGIANDGSVPDISVSGLGKEHLRLWWWYNFIDVLLSPFIFTLTFYFHFPISQSLANGCEWKESALSLSLTLAPPTWRYDRWEGSR